jgi:hypothetical protein
MSPACSPASRVERQPSKNCEIVLVERIAQHFLARRSRLAPPTTALPPGSGDGRSGFEALYLRYETARDRASPKQ